MAQKDFDAFTAELRNFAGLWKSGTVACVAIGGQGVFTNLGTRIVLQPEVHQQRQVLRFHDLTDSDPPLFGVLIRYSLEDTNQLMYQLVGNGRFLLEINDFPCWVEAGGRASGQTGNITPTHPWLPAGRRTRSVARAEWGIDRPLMVLILTGVPVLGVVNPEKLEKLNARLKSHKPEPIAGVVGLIRELMPGAPTDPMQGFAQVVAPLPFDLSYNAESGLTVVAPEVAFENGILVSTFYEPKGTQRDELNIASSRPTFEGYLRRWDGILEWPPTAEAASVVLLYNENEIDTLTHITPPAHTAKETITAVSAEGTKGEGSMDRRSDWEEVDTLGEGGQSRVVLVRRPARSKERAIAIRDIRETNPWHIATNEDPAKKAGQFATAVWNYARPDDPAELGAMKIFEKVREAGPEGERQALARLRSEIAVLRQARAGLPTLLSANEEEKWIVTEFFPMGTLKGHLDMHKGKPGSALTAFHSLVKTVASLHDEGIVHRDIKPANVFIREQSELVLGDFGIVFLPNQPDRPTQTNERVGPSDYMPPWAHRDQRLENVDPNFDVYMLGKLLWCMVAGRLKLFREEHHSREFDLTVAFPNDPDMQVINRILDRCIALDPTACRQSARDLLPDIDEALGILSRGGQLLSDDVPRPCRVCGKGFYRREAPFDREVMIRAWRDQEPVFIKPLRVFACDTCGDVAMFLGHGRA